MSTSGSEDSRRIVASDVETWAIEAQSLTKTFGVVTAVRDVTRQVPCGAIVAFPGPHGSGKSTTVRLLTGLLSPTAGEARVNGRVASVDDLELRPDLTSGEMLGQLAGERKPREDRVH